MLDLSTLSELGQLAAKSMGSRLRIVPEQSEILFGNKVINSEHHLMSCFWCIVNAASRIAHGHWQLTKMAGKPQTDDTTLLDRRAHAPTPGFILRVCKIESPNGKEKPWRIGKRYEHGVAYLQQAINEARKFAAEPDTLEVSLKVSWSEFLPEVDKMDYCRPLFEYKRVEEVEY